MLISSLRKAQWQTEILDFARKHNGIWENWFSMLAAPFTAVTPCVVYCCAYYTLPTLAAPRGEQTRHVYLGHMKGATWCDFKGVSSFSAILEKYHKKDSWRKSHVCSISRWCWKWHSVIIVFIQSVPFHCARAHAAGLAQACNILPWHSRSLFIRHQIQVQLSLRRAQHPGLFNFSENW